MNIYCDLDGVLVDFTGGCKEIFDWPVWDHEPLKDMRGHLRITNKQFWDTIDAHGEEWWANLKPEPWAVELIDIIKFYDPNFTILTSPSLSHCAASGKVLWLQKYFKDKWFTNYIITPAKNKKKLANKQSVLIDDNDKNCTEFREGLGYTVLLPRIWNQNHLLENEKIEYVKSELQYISNYI